MCSPFLTLHVSFLSRLPRRTPTPFDRRATAPRHDHRSTHRTSQDWFQLRIYTVRRSLAVAPPWLVLSAWGLLNIVRKVLPPLYPLIMCDFAVQLYLVERYEPRLAAGIFQLLGLSDIATFIVLRLFYRKFTPCASVLADPDRRSPWWVSDEIRSTLVWLDRVWVKRMEGYSSIMRALFPIGFGTCFWSYPYVGLLWLATRAPISFIVYAIGLVLALAADYMRMVCRLHLYDMFGKVTLEQSVTFPIVLYHKEPLFVMCVVPPRTGTAALVLFSRSSVLGSRFSVLFRCFVASLSFSPPPPPLSLLRSLSPATSLPLGDVHARCAHSVVSTHRRPHTGTRPTQPTPTPA